MATGTSPLLATALLASGVGSLVLTNAAPLSWAVASLSVWSTFVLASSKDGVRQSWLHVLWAYSAAAAFVFYLSTDPGFQVSKICVFAMSEPEDALLQMAQPTQHPPSHASQFLPFLACVRLHTVSAPCEVICMLNCGI